MKHLILTLCCLAATGCANWGYNPIYRYNEVLAVNLAGATIGDVRIAVLGTDKSFGCDSVNKAAMCRDYFPDRRYPGAGIELSWTHVDGSRKAETVNPHVPAYFPSAFPLRVVMEINPDGSVESFYEQDERGDGPMFDTW